MKRIALLALFATSCSWAFSRPPQRPPRRDAPLASVCQPHYVAPVFDTWQAVGGGVLALYLLAASSGSMNESSADTLVPLALITGGVSAVWGASAHYGFKQARACRELRAELARGPSQWIAPSMPGEAPPPEDEMPEVEQNVDIEDGQIDIHTRIRTKPRR